MYTKDPPMVGGRVYIPISEWVREKGTGEEGEREGKKRLERRLANCWHWLNLSWAKIFLIFCTILFLTTFSSVQFSRSVISNSLWPHEQKHARCPCPSPTPRVHPNPSPSSRWCHPTISSSVAPFSSCPQSFLASGSFEMSQLFALGGQNTGVSASTSLLPMNTQDWSLGWTGWISLQCKGLSRVFSNATVQKHQFFGAQLSLYSNSHIHTWPLEKP